MDYKSVFISFYRKENRYKNIHTLYVTVNKNMLSDVVVEGLSNDSNVLYIQKFCVKKKPHILFPVLRAQKKRKIISKVS